MIKRIHISIIIMLLLVFIILIVTFRDYTLILELLNYENTRAVRWFKIDMGVVPNYVHSTVFLTFDALYRNFEARLSAIVGDLKHPRNSKIKHLLFAVWECLDITYTLLPFTVRFTRHLFFIFNLVFFPVNLYFLNSLILALIILFVLSFILLICHPDNHSL